MSMYLVLFLLPMVAGFLAQGWVRRAVARGMEVPAPLTGAEAAHHVLARHGAMEIGRAHV